MTSILLINVKNVQVPEKTLCLKCVSTFVYLGTENGRIHYTDLQKFPLRTKDNSLLVTELHCDYLSEPITALAVSFERTNQKEKCPDPFESLELCYGTAAGTVRIMVQSPEHHTHGLRSLQLLQTYKVVIDSRHLQCHILGSFESDSVCRVVGKVSDHMLCRASRSDLEYDPI